MARKHPSEWFSFNGAVYTPATWEGWVATGVGVLVIASLSTLGVLIAGGQVFH